MKNVSDVFNKYFATIPDFVRKWRVLIWILTLAITVLAIMGFQRLKFDQSTDGWFKDDDPVKVALDDFRAEFGSDDGLYIVYKPKDGNLFSAKSLEAVKGICEDIINARSKIKEGDKSPLAHIVRITSLPTASFLEAKDDMLVSRTLVGTSVPTSQPKLDSIRKSAQGQKNFELAYYSKDLKYGGILIETDFGAEPMDFESHTTNSSDSEAGLVLDDKTKTGNKQISDKKVRFKPTDSKDYLSLMTEINTFLQNTKYEGQLEFYPVGNPAQSTYDAKIMDQMGLLYLAMLLVMIIILWYIFRSFAAVAWTILIIILASVWTIGFSGWMGATGTFYIMLVIMMLLATGMADTIHILSEYLLCRNEEQDHRNALRITFKKVALACVLTTVTTMIGFLALSVSPIVHIKVFGFMTTAGIVLELVFTIYLLPLMLDLWSPVRKIAKPRKGLSAKIGQLIPNISRILQKRIEGIVPLVQRSPIGITLFFAVVFALCIIGASKVSSSFNIMENYEKTSLLRQSYELVDKHMMGTQNMEIFLNLGKENAFQDPDVLTKIDALQQLIEKKYSKYVLHTSSLVNIVKDANQKLNEGKEEMYRVPEKQDVVSQTLFMFNNANPTDRRRIVSDDYSKSHITVNFLNTDADSYQDVFDRMQKDIDQTVSVLKQKYPDTKLSLTGTLAMMMKASTYVADSTGGSLAFAILAITLTLLVVFGSFQAGLIAIVPNLIPSILSYSVLGWFKIPLDMNTLLIGPIIIGVAVDDTIHFITHYREEVLIDGDVIRALKACIKESGQAVIFSTLVLGLGFGIMAFASGPVSTTGWLGTLAIFVGLLCELCLLPAMILIFKPTFKKSKLKKSMQQATVLQEELEEVK